MKNTNSKNIFKALGAWLKERVRKFFVALKKNPQAIPLVALCAAFLQFSLNLSDISDTTARLQGNNMGLAQFVIMLFMLLSFVCMLGAFPKRQKPKVPMIVLMLVLYGSVIFADIHYLACITDALYRPNNPIPVTQNTLFIIDAYNTIIIHIVLIAITVVCVILEPVLAKLLRKIKTSIDVEEGENIAAIEISDED